MSVSAQLRLFVRERAQSRCEYCGVSEQDTAGELTVDHFQPQLKGGTDDLDNLSYCCQRCNQYKSDYWPSNEAAVPLWNPRRDNHSDHFVMLADGTIYPRTAIGSFTIARLRLNRPPLVAYRLRHTARIEEAQLLVQFRDVIGLLEQLQTQHAALLNQQRVLLEEQRALIFLLLRQQGRTDE